MSAQPDVSPAACTARLAVYIAHEWCREYALAIDDAIGPDEIAAANARYVVAVEVLQEAMAVVRAIKKVTP